MSRYASKCRQYLDYLFRRRPASNFSGLVNTQAYLKNWSHDMGMAFRSWGCELVSMLEYTTAQPADSVLTSLLVTSVSCNPVFGTQLLNSN